MAASGTYCLVYWVIPFCLFLNYLHTKTQFTAMDYVYATLFSLTLIAYPISIAGSSGMLYMSLYTLLGLLIIEQLLEVLKTMQQYGYLICCKIENRIVLTFFLVKSMVWAKLVNGMGIKIILSIR